MRARSACVHDALGDAFVVEMEDFLPQHEVFQERRSARAGSQAVLIVGYSDPLVGGEMRFGGPVRTLRGHMLMGFAAIAAGSLEVALSHVSTSNDAGRNARRPEPVLCPSGLSRRLEGNDRLQPRRDWERRGDGLSSACHPPAPVIRRGVAGTWRVGGGIGEGTCREFDLSSAACRPKRGQSPFGQSPPAGPGYGSLAGTRA